MNEIIKIDAWNQNIALATQINQKFIVELLNEEYSIFSPLCFENDRFAIAGIRNISQEIDKIGVVADSINSAYGKGYFEKYYVDTKGSFPSMLDHLSFIGSNGLGAIKHNRLTILANKLDIAEPLIEAILVILNILTLLLERHLAVKRS